MSLLAAVWIAPLLARTIRPDPLRPIGFLASLILFVLILRAAAWNRDEFPRALPRVAGATTGPLRFGEAREARRGVERTHTC